MIRRNSILLALLIALGPAGNVFAQQLDPEIADIVVEGGKTVDLETVAYYLGLYPGDPLDLELVAEGFRRMWDSELFENLRLEIENLEDGRVKLFVIVEERPIVSSVIFEGGRKNTASDIRDGLDEKGVELPRKVPLRESQLQSLERSVRAVLSEKGYQSAAISYRIEDLSGNEKRVIFDIDEGGKVKIKEIEFLGNDVYSNRRLRRSLKETKTRKWFWPFGKKIIYQEETWAEDQVNLRNFYMNHGYKDIKIGQPQVELKAMKPEARTLKKQNVRALVTIPVEEGRQFSLGIISIRGTEVVESENLMPLFETKKDGQYSYKLIENAMENIRDIYHNQGYIYAYTNQVLEDVEGDDPVVNVVIDVFEGVQFHLNRIEFTGNTSTRDKVLRREFFIGEGSIMNMGAFRSSVFKANALGYWKLTEDPLDFDFDDDAEVVDVVVEGEEVGRNDIQFGAGYSEVDGFFAQLQFNTRNFLGRGNSLGLSLQTGDRSDFFTVSFSEPYLRDRRILLGASIFKTQLDIADFFRETTGGQVSIGFGVGPYQSMSLVYSYEDVISEFATALAGTIGNPTGGHDRPTDLPGTEPDVLDRTVQRFDGTIASITPTFVKDSRDDPFDTNRGQKLIMRHRFAGNGLGGDFDYYRPEIQFSLFKALTKKTVFGANFEGGQFFTQEGDGIPTFERYRSGGDQSLRGIRSYSVLPLDEEGELYRTDQGAALGGDRYWVFNTELQFKLGGPVKLVAFVDLGNTYHEDQGWDFGEFRKTTGLELRINLPIFQAPLRFIYGVNLDPVDPDGSGSLGIEDSTDFQFSIGSTF